jgi:hypothetical protein
VQDLPGVPRPRVLGPFTDPECSLIFQRFLEDEETEDEYCIYVFANSGRPISIIGNRNGIPLALFLFKGHCYYLRNASAIVGGDRFCYK